MQDIQTRSTKLASSFVNGKGGDNFTIRVDSGVVRDHMGFSNATRIYSVVYGARIKPLDSTKTIVVPVVILSSDLALVKVDITSEVPKLINMEK